MGLTPFQRELHKKVEQAATRAAETKAGKERREREADAVAAGLAQRKDDKARNQSRLEMYNKLKVKMARIAVVKAMDGLDSITNSIKMPDLNMGDGNLKAAAETAIRGVDTVIRNNCGASATLSDEIYLSMGNSPSY
eukprot:gene2341-8639_t